MKFFSRVPLHVALNGFRTRELVCTHFPSIREVWFDRRQFEAKTETPSVSALGSSRVHSLY